MKGLMTLCVLLCTLVCTANAQKKFTAQCGEKVMYTVDLKAKKLTLKGSGAMYSYSGKMPWSQYAGEISTLEVLGNIYGISGRLFHDLTSLETIVSGNTDRYFAEDGCLFTSDSVLCMGRVVNPVIPEWTKRIGDEAFCMYTSLSDITIPSGVTSIGYGAFAGCASLSSIDIPSPVQTVGKAAFAQCTSLARATIAAGTIGQEAFRGCSALSELTMLPSVMSIDYAAFYECKALTKVDIPLSVTSIGQGAFAGCSALSEVSIPSELSGIGIRAFYKCTSLPSENHVRYADKWAVDLDDTGQESYVVREGTEGIAGGLFAECRQMTEVTIPSGVRFMGDKVFAGCHSLRKINLADSISDVLDKAFLGVDCSKVTTSVLGGRYLYMHGASAPVDSLMAWVEASADDEKLELRRDDRGALADIIPSNALEGIASFPGGDAELASFLVKNLSCEEAFLGDTCIMALVSFKVGVDGTISDVKVDSTLNKAVADDLVRVVGLMPKWKPQTGRQLKSYTGSFTVVFPYKDESDVLAEERNASFPGGDEACFRWLAKNIKYPTICQEQGVQGRVLVRFVVDKDGTIIDPQIVRSPDEHLSEEALRLVKLMPKWKPATIGNKKVRKTVRSRFTLPIWFRLS